MKAMILAAGKGTRLQPLTNYLPKPMLTLLGRPVLDSIIELLANHGVHDIIINTSHLASEIENYFRDG
ncbi:MAG: sugar phosphate nucleotidyltransferase, partial [Gammaproteobacteria bacterium]|nr:sugar phosphate nucleotidyltransferase [Gammaproteobacteria bacterium]